MNIPSATAALFGHLLSACALVSTAGALAQPSTPGVEEAWATTNDFAGKMMDIDRSDNVYSVGDTIVGGIVLTRKFSADGILQWERSYRPDFAVKVNWVAADPNGGAYVVGYKYTGSSQSPIGYFVLRYDVNGNLAWSDVKDGAGLAVRAVTDRAGNAYVSGTFSEAGSVTIGIVKYSPSGGRQWVCPAVNPNGNGFPGTPAPTGLYLSENGNWISASGTSAYVRYVLSCEASGVKRWQDFRSASVYAGAVAVNNQGEVYFGDGLIGGTGMQVTKYSAAGAVQWTNVYSPGSYIHRLALDSQGNVIAIGPDYGTSYYANWVTMKVAPTGARTWSRTFDALAANHEIPYFVAVDAFDSVYVTGVGGPPVIASNGSSYMRMVTLKYTGEGGPVWTIGSPTGGIGNAVRIGADPGSVFVQGYGGMYTARYRQTGLPDVPAAPAAPSSLVLQYTGSAMALAWTDNSIDEARFDVERCEGAGCNTFAAVGSAAADTPHWSDTGVDAGRSYSYRVRAWASSGGYSSYSNVATATTPATPTATVPAAPANLSASALSSASIRLQWSNRSANQAGVSVERCKAPCKDFTEIARVAGSATSVIDTGLAARTSYSYRVRAYNADGWSAYSASVTAKTLR